MEVLNDVMISSVVQPHTHPLVQFAMLELGLSDITFFWSVGSMLGLASWGHCREIGHLQEEG